MNNDELFQKYEKELSSLPGVSTKRITNIHLEFTGSDKDALKVTLRHWQQGGDFVLLDIAGVDCGWWNTAEEENLDFYSDIAKAALRGDVEFRRSPIFKRKEGCFRVKGYPELDNMLVCIPVKNIFTEYRIRKNPKSHIKHS